VPDPQYLGFVNLRINDVASDITTEYEEHAQFVKLLLPEGARDPVAWLAAGEFLIRHRDTFLEQLAAREVFIRQGFSHIQTLDYTPTFDHAVTLATEFLREIPESGPVHKPRSR
jgi:hypothetical protein